MVRYNTYRMNGSHVVALNHTYKANDQSLQQPSNIHSSSSVQSSRPIQSTLPKSTDSPIKLSIQKQKRISRPINIPSIKQNQQQSFSDASFSRFSGSQPLSSKVITIYCIYSIYFIYLIYSICSIYST